MKRLSLLCSLLLLMAGTVVHASVLDAPHNETNGMYCNSCHTYSLWWKYSPAEQDVNYASNTTGICLQCHDGSDVTIPHADIHSQLTTESTKTWPYDAVCIDCHDPHRQRQLDRANPYLITGAVATTPDATAGGLPQITVDDVNGETTITFASVTTNAKWPPVSPDPVNAPLDWTKKNMAGDRPLILVQDTTFAINTFQIISVDELNSQIVVNGKIDISQVDSDTCNYDYTCGNSSLTFGLIYGQMIKTLVKGNEVDFFDGQGGFVDTVNTPAKGICQVCHTQTSHWRADSADPAADITHNVDANCTKCHDHSKGFKMDGHPIDHFPWTAATQASCGAVSCHDSASNTDVVATIHSGTCTMCHNNGNGGRGTAIAGSPVNGVDGDATLPVAAAAPAILDLTTPLCTDCHLNGTHIDYASHASEHNVTDYEDTPTQETVQVGNCATCHSNFLGSGRDFAAISTAHVGLIIVSADITGTTDGTINGSAITCQTCHQSGVAAVSSTINDAKNNSLVASCADCHGPRSTGHGGHSASTFAWAGNCADCHSGLSIVENVHGNNCLLCHNNNSGGSGTTIVGTDGNAQLAAGAGYATATCLTCHTAALPTIHHVNDGSVVYSPIDDCVNCHDIAKGLGGHEGNHATLVSNMAPCDGCHTATATAGTDGNVLVDGVAGNLVHDACKSCHTINTANANMVELVATANYVTTMNPGTSATNDGGGNCKACHTAYFDAHTHSPHNVSGAAACTSCHDNGTNSSQARDAITAPYTANGEVHDNLKCATCHNLTTGAFNANTNGGLGGTCTDCHGADWQVIHTSTTNVSHTSFVTNNLSTCATSCHDAVAGGSLARNAITTPYTSGSEVHASASCGTCHDTAGNLLAGSGFADTVVVGNCEACHTSGTGTWSSIHTSATNVSHATYVMADTNCTTSSCHDATSSGVARGTSSATAYTGVNDVHAAGCATCHNTDGTLRAGTKGTAVGGRGDCSSCHSAGWEAIHTGVTLVDHSTRVAALGTCATCHTGTGGNAQIAVSSATDRAGDMLHDGCTDCHGANGGILVPYGYASNIAAGDCGTCHGATYFDSHEHGTVTGYISHVVTYNPLVDLSQVSLPGDNPCGDCHDGNNADTDGVSLNSWTDIVSEHLSACATCHSYSAGTTPPVLTSNGAIGSRTAATCTTCHTPKLDPAASSDHGGHDNSVFAWAGNCADCHSGAGVVANVHSNTCTLCHTTNAGGLGTTIVGTDGNAQLAAGAGYATATCLTCHTAALPTIHHVNDGSVVYSPIDDCINCHDIAKGLGGHEGNHATLVSNMAPCDGCHTATATAGTDGNVLVDGVAGNLVHDACKSCHTINTANANMVELVASANYITTMNPGTSATNDGGGNCKACHTAYFDAHTHSPHNVSGAAACTSCHDNGTNSSQARDAITAPYTAAGQVHDTLGCATCHNMTTGAFNANTNGGLGGTCTDCHGTAWDTIHAASSVTHTSYVTNTASSCAATCHDATAGGSLARNAITTPYTSGSEVHASASCGTCHDATGGLLAGSGFADTVVVGNCEACHTSGTGTWSSIHTATTNVSHATYVMADTNCTASGCHDATSTGVARGTSSATAYTGVNDVHAAGCATCHNTDGTLKAGTKGTAVGGAGDCSSCHSAGWEAIHTGVALVDHSTRVAELGTCVTCHTGTGGNAQIAVNSATDRAGDMVHDGCTDCHDANGATLAAYGYASAITAGDCGTCHGATYFDSHEHGTDAGYISHVVTYNSLVDLSQVSLPGDNPCGDCHDGNNADTDGVALNSWTDIVSEHLSACATCHSYSAGTTPPVLTSNGAIGNRTAATCTTCHTPKLDPAASSDHGGHDDTIFAWAGNCADCHSGAGVVANVHSNTCTLCHTSNAGGLGTTIVGTDGNAQLAAGAGYATATCLTCHTAALPTIHHVNDGSVVYSPIDDCINCHDIAKGTGGHEGNHATLVSNMAPCDGCHTATATAGTDGNVLVDGVAGNLVHDACKSCHTINTANANMVELVATANYVTTMNPGTSATNDGGGNCKACHTAYFDAHTHTPHNVSGALACTSCHDNGTNSSQARDAITAPYTANGEVHDNLKCATCHNLTTGAFNANTNGGLGGTCTDCHGTDWQAIHTSTTSVSHTSYVTNNLSGCAASCHDPVPGGSLARNAITAPYTSGNEVHATGSCATCHDTAGGLLAGGGFADTVIQGNCEACHTSGTGTWSTIHTSATNVSHATYVMADTNCTTSSCHDATSTGVARGTSTANAYTGANDVHAAGCATCHNTDGTLRAGTKGTAVGGRGDCSSCHSAGWATIHTGVALVDHSTRVAALGTCATCHTGTGGNAQIAVSSATDRAGDMLHDGCTDCHDANGGILLPYGYASAITAGDCGTCHGATYFDSHEHGTDVGYISHVVSYTAADQAQTGYQGCGECHDDAGLGKGLFGVANALTTWDAIKTEHFSACATCHSYSAGDTPPVATSNGAIGSRTAATCVTCHAPKIAPNGHGGHDASQFAGDAECTKCHTIPATGIVEGIHKNQCTTCHATSSGGTGTTILGANGDGDARLGVSAAPHSTVTCLTCHPSATYPADGIHHDTAHPQAGDCTYCHDDPRGAPGVDWGTQYSVTGTMPKQLACQSCHVEPAGNDFVVNRLSYTPVALSSSPGTTFNVDSYGVATIQNLGAVHTITATGSRINVYNYGACLGCHDGNYGTAPAVSIYHAKPVKLAHNRDSWTTSPFDTLRYAPGRDKFFKFRADFRDPKDFMKNGAAQNRGKNVFKSYNTNGWPTPNPNIQDQDTVIPCFSLMNSRSKCTNGTNVTVPTFNDISTPAFPDNVQVQSAEWNGADLVVTATNNDGCAALSVTTQPDGISRGSMSGTTTCSLTVAVGSLPTSVDVNTTNALGTNVTGYAVTDTSGPNPGVISFTSATYSVAENGGSISITVNRTGGLGAASVNYATSNGTAVAGTDYTAASGTLNWADGITGTQSFNIPVIDDAILQGDLTVNLTLSGVVTSTLGTSSAVLTIVDDETPACGTLSVLNDWSNQFERLNGAGTNTSTPAVSAGNSRLLVVNIGGRCGSGTCNNAYTVTYGGQSPTFTTGANDAGRIMNWVGYWDESAITAAGANATLSVTVSASGTAPTGYNAQAITFANVNQTYPLHSSGAVVTGNGANYGTNMVAGPVSFDADDMVVVGGGSYDVTWGNSSPYNSGIFSTIWGVAARRNAVTAGPTTESATFTASNARWIATALPIQSECNNN